MNPVVLTAGAVAGFLALRSLGDSVAGTETDSPSEPDTTGNPDDGSSDSFELGGGTSSIGQGSEYWDKAESAKMNEHFWGWAANELLRNDMDASGVGALFSGITQGNARYYTLDELVQESDDIESPKEALQWREAWMQMGQPMTDGSHYSPPNYDNETGEYDTSWMSDYTSSDSTDDGTTDTTSDGDWQTGTEADSERGYLDG